MLETIGFDAALASSFAPWDAADATAGRVLRVDRGVCTVLTEKGPRRATFGGGFLQSVARDPSGAPCPGDWCVLRCWPDGPLTLEVLLPRRAVVPAPPVGDRPVDEPPLAANVDVVALLLPASGATLPADTRSAQEAAGAGGATTVLVSTGRRRAARSSPGTQPLHVDTASGEGIADLVALIEGRRTLGLCCLAPTHPHRSCAAVSLVSALVGAATLSGTAPLGVHPHPELVPLPAGGAVIDLSSTRCTHERNHHAARPVS